MKGADDLVRVAKLLRQSGLPFHLSIFGDGDLKSSMTAEIEREGLNKCVTLEGVLDFHAGLMPRVRETVDLFVCCHRQGDPSCTYLETLSAGVPIVGYANEAFAGLARFGKFGWTVPLGNSALLAQEISRLAQSRAELTAAAEAAISFARQHTFAATFQRRVAHLREVARSAPRPRAKMLARALAGVKPIRVALSI
jgi:glycosyltransferase involved in cell wall biosynthesis